MALVDVRFYAEEICKVFTDQTPDMHFHAFPEICLIRSGNIKLHYHGSDYRLIPGDIYLMPPYTPHGEAILPGNPEITVFYLYGLETSNTKYFPFVEARLLHIPDKSSIYGLIKKLTELYSRRNGKLPFTKPTENFVLLMDRLSELPCILHDAEGYDEMDELVDAIMAEIGTQGYLNKKMGTLSDRFHYSEQHINRIFKKKTGMTLYRYKTKSKIQIARFMLCSKPYPAAKISRDLGFSSPQYFYTVFKKETGMTPNEYRSRTTKNSPADIAFFGKT